jgi:poly(hydroxyalkanoate) depolymerase family esterase
MMKGLNRLWLRSLKRASKAQQSQTKKLIKSLLPKPAAKRASSKKIAVKRATVPASKPSVTLVSRNDVLPGKWLASYYSSISETGALPARRMSYWLYLPAKPASTPIPMVVMLHGCGQTAPQFSRGTRMNQLAEEKGFAVLYPQQSLRGHPNRCWHWYEKGTQEGGGDVELIIGLMDNVRQKYPIDPTRIYVAGLSAGAAMAHIIALNHPSRIAAVALHSGTVFGAGHSRMEALSVMQLGSSRIADTAMKGIVKKFGVFPKMPALLIHGQEDKVVRPVNLVHLTKQFQSLNGLPGEDQPAVVKETTPGKRSRANAYRTEDYYSGRKLMLRTCEIHGLDHAWSGGDCSLKFNSCAGPDATKMMWNFFARHRRRFEAG